MLPPTENRPENSRVNTRKTRAGAREKNQNTRVSRANHAKFTRKTRAQQKACTPKRIQAGKQDIEEEKSEERKIERYRERDRER
jgi:hypothetical protein